jgi:hypothetical protein
VRDEIWQLAAVVAATMAQLYMTEPWKFTAVARFWDWLARITGRLANWLGHVSMHARASYYDSIAVGE